MYQNELARSGHALFKVRGGYLITVVIIGAVIAYCSGKLGPFASDAANQAWFGVSFGIAAVGALIRIITSGYAAPGTSGVAKDAAVAAELNTTGPYSLVRNPLYLGRILNFTGIAMMSGSWVYGALTLLISVLVYERISVYEEEFLRKEFGEAHARWAAEVPFLLPRLHGWVKPKYPFWVRRSIKREDKKVFLLITAVVLNDVANSVVLDDLSRHDFVIGSWSALPTLYYVYAVIALIYVLLRALRHFTKTFDGIS